MNNIADFVLETLFLAFALLLVIRGLFWIWQLTDEQLKKHTDGIEEDRK